MIKLDKKYFKDYQGELEERSIDLKKLFQNFESGSEELDFSFLIDESAVYSSNIEGNPLSVEAFLQSKKAPSKIEKKDAKEISDLVESYEFARENPLSEKNLLLSHEKASEVLLAKSKRGKYRNEKVGVWSAAGLVYLAVEPEYVEREMTKLFAAIDELLKKDLRLEEVFYFASFLHLVLAHVHPFSDGNGRTARLLEKWFLKEKLGDSVWAVPSEKYYWTNRPRYYENINLGVNYYEINYDGCVPFLMMLAGAMV